MQVIPPLKHAQTDTLHRRINANFGQQFKYKSPRLSIGTQTIGTLEKRTVGIHKQNQNVTVVCMITFLGGKYHFLDSMAHLRWYHNFCVILLLNIHHLGLYITVEENESSTKDLNYVPSEETLCSSEDDDISEDESLDDDENANCYIVYLSQLDILFKYCWQCGHPIDKSARKSSNANSGS